MDFAHDVLLLRRSAYLIIIKDYLERRKHGMKFYGIYKITNLLNGKMYIG